MSGPGTLKAEPTPLPGNSMGPATTPERNRMNFDGSAGVAVCASDSGAVGWFGLVVGGVSAFVVVFALYGLWLLGLSGVSQ